jgi:tight adherence protein B
MITAWLVAVLAVLLAAPAARRLRNVPRRPSPSRRRARHGGQPTTDYATLLEAIARQVRSGSSLTQALIDEAGAASALSGVADRLLGGSSLAAALDAADPGDADQALTVQALSATANLGGPVAATLDAAAAVLRERAAARAERRAHGAQARLSARVLTIVPLGFALWSAAISQPTRHVYVATYAGAVCAVCGIVLNLTGWRWMRRIIGPA